MKSWEYWTSTHSALRGSRDIIISTCFTVFLLLSLQAVDDMNGKELNGRQVYVGRAQKKGERQNELKRKFEQMKQDRMTRYQVCTLPATYITAIQNHLWTRYTIWCNDIILSLGSESDCEFWSTRVWTCTWKTWMMVLMMSACVKSSLPLEPSQVQR